MGGGGAREREGEEKWKKNKGLSWGQGEIFLKKETYPAGKGNEKKRGKKKKINNDTYLGAGGREREGLKKEAKKVKIITGRYLGLEGMGK